MHPVWKKRHRSLSEDLCWNRLLLLPPWNLPISGVGYLSRLGRNSTQIAPVLPHRRYPSVRMKLSRVDSSEYHCLLLNIFCNKGNRHQYNVSNISTNTLRQWHETYHGAAVIIAYIYQDSYLQTFIMVSKYAKECIGKKPPVTEQSEQPLCARMRNEHFAKLVLKLPAETDVLFIICSR